MSRRTDQVAALMQQELGSQILGIELPSMTTIAKVEVTADLKHAKVWITIMSDDKAVEAKVLAELKEHAYDMQGELNRKLSMHHVPRFRFVVDGSQKYASRINELIRKAQDEKAE